MNDQIEKTLEEQAEECYSAAQEALYKPEEDIVHYMVCRNAFKASQKFLAAYLAKNGVVSAAEQSLEESLEKSKTIDDKFNDLDLTPFFHASEEKDVWMDMHTAQEFMDMATKTRKLVVEV